MLNVFLNDLQERLAEIGISCLVLILIILSMHRGSFIEQIDIRYRLDRILMKVSISPALEIG